MRPLVLAGVLALSSSRAGCGTALNSMSIAEQRDRLAKEQERVDALSRELARTRDELSAARAEITLQRAWAAEHSEWSSEQIRKLSERLEQLEREIASLKKRPGGRGRLLQGVAAQASAYSRGIAQSERGRAARH